MKEAERLAERLETEAAAWEHHGNQSEWRETLRSAAALIRSQAEELERLREALREIAVPIPKDFQPDGSAERGHLSRSYKAGVYDRAHVKARAALGER